MSDKGIGAAVRRKEDFRFLTGKGSYTENSKRYLLSNTIGRPLRCQESTSLPNPRQ